jgi:hypothetical protein
VVIEEPLKTLSALLLKRAGGDFAIDLLANRIDLGLEGTLAHHFFLFGLQLPKESFSLLLGALTALLQDVLLSQFGANLQADLIKLWLVLLILNQVIFPQGVLLCFGVVTSQ